MEHIKAEIPYRAVGGTEEVMVRTGVLRGQREVRVGTRAQGTSNLAVTSCRWARSPWGMWSRGWGLGDWSPQARLSLPHHGHLPGGFYPNGKKSARILLPNH